MKVAITLDPVSARKLLEACTNADHTLTSYLAPFVLRSASGDAYALGQAEETSDRGDFAQPGQVGTTEPTTRDAAEETLREPVSEERAPRAPRVFICYAHRDDARAMDLFRRLTACGAAPWIDKNNLRLGDDWEHEIKKAVDTADVFVVCLRPGFDEIGFRQQEVRWAKAAWMRRPSGRAFILPFIIEPCGLPDWCRPIHAGSDLSHPTSFDDLVKAIEKHAGVGLTRRRPILDPILQSLTKHIVKAVNSFAQGGCPAIPHASEHHNWYATVLLRPTQLGDDGRRILANRFIPIYFANFRGRSLVATSDWIESPHLLVNPIDIAECCSGLAVRWREMGEDWQQDSANDGLLRCEVDAAGHMKYLVLRDVSEARHIKENNLIRETYMTDRADNSADWPRAVGWDLREEDGTEMPMSQRIRTEMLVPIYDLLPTAGKAMRAILGVANFEWEESLSRTRETEIGEWLANRIQKDRSFPISLFICDVLGHFATSEYEAGWTMSS